MKYEYCVEFCHSILKLSVVVVIERGVVGSVEAAIAFWRESVIGLEVIPPVWKLVGVQHRP